MERKLYSLTEKQIAKCAGSQPVQMPSDEDFKARGKKERKPWGILKRDWAKTHLFTTVEYQQGLWQGRVDRANGLDYSDERPGSAYNLGYYIGWTNYESNRRGWDAATREWFDATYLNA